MNDSTVGHRRRATVFIGALWSVTVLFALAAARYSASVVATPHGSAADEPLAAELGFLVVYLTLSTVGAVVARRRPRHPIGWLFLGCALLFTASALGHGRAHHAVLIGEPETALAQWAGLLGVVLFLPAFVAMLMYLPLIFPDGRLLSPRWRPLAWILAVVVGALTLVELLRPGPLSGFDEIESPLGVTGTEDILAVVVTVTDPIFVPIVASIGVAVTLRFRRATASERQQFKWVALPAGVLLVFLPANEFWLRDADGLVRMLKDIVFFAAFAGLPVGLAIAVLRYRLYDIDRLLSRTVTYSALSLLLVGVYVSGVVALGAAARAVTGSTSNDLAVAASTLMVAALAQPARRVIQRGVARRFNRADYDAARTVEGFGHRLRNQLDPDALLAETREVVASVLQPVTVSVWTPSSSAPTVAGVEDRGVWEGRT